MIMYYNIMLYSTDAAVMITNGAFAWDAIAEVPTVKEYVYCVIF